MHTVHPPWLADSVRIALHGVTTAFKGHVKVSAVQGLTCSAIENEMSLVC